MVLGPAARLALACILAMCVAAAPASAAFDDVALTELWTDPADHAGILDLRALSVGETGDGKLLFRLETADMSLPPNGRAIWFFSVGDQAYGPGVNVGGTPTTFVSGTDPTAFADATPESCVLDGAAAYCLVPYEKFGGAPGVVLTGNYGASYFNAAQDYAPGPGGFVPQALLGPTGSDYTLTGCTKTAGCGAGAGAVVHGNLSAPKVTQAFTTPTTATYVHNFTQPAAAATLQYVANGTGNVSVLVTDGNGTARFNETLAGGANGTASLQGAVPGNWSFRLGFQAFNGTFELEVKAQTASTTSSGTATGSGSKTGTASAGGSGSGSGTGGATGGNGTADDGDAKDSPSLALPLLAAALVAVAVALRRRR